MNNDFKEENNKFREYQRALQGYKRQLNRIQQEQRKADWEMRRKEAEGPIDADVPSDDPLIGHPWAEEILQVAYNPHASCHLHQTHFLPLELVHHEHVSPRG